MNQVTRRRLKRLEMDDYDLGHLDSLWPEFPARRSIAEQFWPLLRRKMTAPLRKIGRLRRKNAAEQASPPDARPSPSVAPGVASRLLRRW